MGNSLIGADEMIDAAEVDAVAEVDVVDGADHVDYDAGMLKYVVHWALREIQGFYDYQADHVMICAYQFDSMPLSLAVYCLSTAKYGAVQDGMMMNTT